jgi:hypothetical protein
MRMGNDEERDFSSSAGGGEALPGDQIGPGTYLLCQLAAAVCGFHVRFQEIGHALVGVDLIFDL